MRLLIFGLISIIFLGCASQAPDTDQLSEPPQTFEYKIGAGDRLNIFVLDYPEVNQQVTVRPDGIISLPLIGDVEAKGKKPVELEKELEMKFTEFIRSPDVTVNVIAAKSYVFIRGGVNKPGSYTYTEGMSVLQLITLAGDFTLFADRNDIIILREKGNAREVIKVKLKSIDSNYKPTYVEPGDIVIVGS